MLLFLIWSIFALLETKLGFSFYFGSPLLQTNTFAVPSHRNAGQCPSLPYQQKSSCESCIFKCRIANIFQILSKKFLLWLFPQWMPYIATVVLKHSFVASNKQHRSVGSPKGLYYLLHRIHTVHFSNEICNEKLIDLFMYEQ